MANGWSGDIPVFLFFWVLMALVSVRLETWIRLARCRMTSASSPHQFANLFFIVDMSPAVISRSLLISLGKTAQYDAAGCLGEGSWPSMTVNCMTRWWMPLHGGQEGKTHKSNLGRSVEKYVVRVVLFQGLSRLLWPDHGYGVLRRWLGARGRRQRPRKARVF